MANDTITINSNLADVAPPQSAPPDSITINPDQQISPESVAAANKIAPNKNLPPAPTPAPKSYPMFAPSGELGDVPVGKLQDATKSGFVMGRHVVSPDGQSGIVPENRLAEAIKSGMKRDKTQPEGPNSLELDSPEYTSHPSIRQRILGTKPATGPLELAKMTPWDAARAIDEAGTFSLQGAMTPEEQRNHPMLTGGLELTGSLASPSNIAIMAATAGLGTLVGPQAKAASEIIPRLISGGFTLGQVIGASKDSSETWDAIKGVGKYADMSPEERESEAKRLVTHVIGGIAFAALGAQHAIGMEATPSTRLGEYAQQKVDTAGMRISQALKSDIDALQSATNRHESATAVYDQRTYEHGIATDQAIRASQAAKQAKEDFSKGLINKQQFDDTNDLASKAAANARKATEALNDSHEAQAMTGAEKDRMTRKIQKSKVPANEKQDKAVARAITDYKRMAPPTATRQGAYSDRDLQIALGYAEREHENEPIATVQDHADALQKVSDDIDNEVGSHIQTYANEPITTNVRMDVRDALADSPQVNFVKDGLNYLSENFNLIDPTLSEAQSMLTDLNALNRATLKKNFWDVATALRSDPEFAARYHAADSLRNGIDGTLVEHSINGVRDLRRDQASVIRVKTAVEKQVNKGAQVVRGSGESGLFKKAAGKSAVYAGTAAGVGLGAATGIPGAPEVGGIVGGLAGKKIGKMILPGDVTRNELAQRLMQVKGKGVQTTELEGTPDQPNELIPPSPVSPRMNMFVPQRELTPLHSELATHYGEHVADTNYPELEQRFMEDIGDKKRHGVPLEPAEKTLLGKINQANAADQLAAQKQMQEAAAKGKSQQGAANLPDKVEPLLQVPSNRLGEGMDTQSGIVHDIAHIIVGQERGIKFEDGIRSHLHAENVKAGSLMSAPVDWSPFMDKDGNVDINKIKTKIADIAATYVAGGVANDLYHDIPFTENHNLGADIDILKRFMKNSGFSEAESSKMIAQAADDAAQVLSKPGVQQVLEQHAAVRESGLDDRYHVSPERMEQILKDVNNETTGGNAPRTAGEGKRAAKEAGTGAEGKTKAGDTAELRPAGQGPASGEGGAVKGSTTGDETSPTASVESLVGSGEAKQAVKPAAQTPEWRQQQISNVIGQARDILRDPEATEDEKTWANRVIESSPQNPKLSEKQEPKDIVEGEGLKYKGELVPGSDVHMFEHPDHPGRTAALQGPLTLEAVRSKMQDKLQQFGVNPKLGPKNDAGDVATKRDAQEFVKYWIEKGHDASYEPIYGPDGGVRGYHTSLRLNAESPKLSVAEHADQYNKEQNQDKINTGTVSHDPNFAKRTADAFDQMQHTPNEPKTAAAYQAMKNDVDKQWDYATQKMGMKFEPWDKPGQPYANSKEMAADVKNNNHLYFFQGGDFPVDHPMAKVDPKTGLTYNDKFRAVHDLFGHAAQGNQFGPKGEETAYQLHRQMFSPEAVPALTSETRGQNSWVNYGKHLRDEQGNIPVKGEQGYVPPIERKYSEQKAGLLPEEFHQANTGQHWSDKVASNLETAPAGGINPNNPGQESKRYGFEILPEARQQLDQNPTAQDLRQYAERHNDKLGLHPDIKLGWDTTGDKPELNIGAATDDLDKAKQMAAKLDQRSLWDNKEDKTIDTGGTGKKTAFPEYPLQQRLTDLGTPENPKLGAKQVLRAVADKYGESDDASKTGSGASFITPEGKFIHLGQDDHQQVMFNHGYDQKSDDDRVPFINQSGAVRTNLWTSRAGRTMSFSVPENGVNPEQIDAMKRAVREGLGTRNGQVRVETAETPTKVKNTIKDFATANDIEPMLHEIGAHPGAPKNPDDMLRHELKTELGVTGDDPRNGLPNKVLAKQLKNQRGIDALNPKPVAKDRQNDAVGWIKPNGDFQKFGKLGQKYAAVTHPEDAGRMGTSVENLLQKGYVRKAGQGSYEANDLNPLTKKAIENDIIRDYHDITHGTADYGDILSHIVIDTKKGTHEIPVDDFINRHNGDLNRAIDKVFPEESNNPKLGPRGSSVPLMTSPLKIKGTGDEGKINTLDVAKALNQFTKNKIGSLELNDTDDKQMTDRAKRLSEDEAKYQLHQDNSGKDWYTKDIGVHDDILRDMRPELADPVKLSLFKMSEAVLSSGQKPYANIKFALKNWDYYHETGEFSPTSVDTGRSWGPRSVSVYGYAMDTLNRLIKQKGEKGASDWLLAEHPVSEIRQIATPSVVRGRAGDMQPGVLALGPKRGPFAQNLHGIESAFTADRWVSRTWNRWMGTTEVDYNQGPFGEITTDSPRNQTERNLMKESFAKTAQKLGLSTSSLQAVLWFYEKNLYEAQGARDSGNFSFADAAKRIQKEQAEQEPVEFRGE